MNSRQERALELMRAPLKDTEYQRRDLYEGAGKTSNTGSGLYWITRTAGAKYEQLTTADVAELVAAGLIEPRGPGCYQLVDAGKKGTQ